MKRILISGGSGLVGSRLTALLLQKGYEVAHLSRKPPAYSKVPCYKWDVVKQEIETGAFEGVDCIIHLAGEAIVEKSWTPERKAAILESRTQSAALLFKEVSKLQIKPQAFISASAVGYYGFTDADKLFVEDDQPATDFTGITCLAWENAVIPFESIMRTVRIRIGILLSNKGGALKPIALPIKLGFAAALGSGKQIVPWIHEDDVCGIFISAIEDAKMQGVYNAVAPEIKNQKELTKALAKALHRPYFLPNVPEFVLKLILGSRAPLVLKGNAVSCQKIIDQGYVFLYPDLASALSEIYAD